MNKKLTTDNSAACAGRQLVPRSGIPLRGTTQKGQILVMMLLIMVVGMTVGLFLLGRTTTDISLTTKITDSSRAFNAAEAGIEEAIRSTVISESGASPSPVTIANGVTYSVVTSEIGGTSGIYPAEPNPALAVGETFTVWFVPHDADGNPDTSTSIYQKNLFDVCFTTNTPEPAIGITLFYKSGGTFRSGYVIYDSVPGGATFEAEPPSGSHACYNAYDYVAALNFSDGSIFGRELILDPPVDILVAIRITSLYAPTQIAVVPATGSELPAQGNSIASAGKAGETTRKIQVAEPYGVLPPFMDHVIYSYGTGYNLEK